MQALQSLSVFEQVLLAVMAGILLMLFLILVALIANGRRLRQGLLGRPAQAFDDDGRAVLARQWRETDYPEEEDHPGEILATHLQPSYASVPSAVAAERPSRGILGKLVWFVVGIAVTIGVMALLNPTLMAEQRARLAAAVERFIAPAPVGDDDGSGAPKSDDRVTAGAETARVESASPPVATTLGDLIDAYITRLRPTLPLTTAPGINLTAATADGETIALNFEVAETLDEENWQKLQTGLEPHFRDMVCARAAGPGNIRGLNERGATFQITYTDLAGRTGASLTVTPDYCATAAKTTGGSQ